MEMVKKLGQMDQIIKDSLLMGRNKVMEHLHGMIMLNILEISMMISKMVFNLIVIINHFN